MKPGAVQSGYGDLHHGPGASRPVVWDAPERHPNLCRENLRAALSCSLVRTWLARPYAEPSARLLLAQKSLLPVLLLCLLCMLANVALLGGVDERSL
jgi:hypothetical protein